jgi:SHAQKYF class myb-like DNA-binding protein
MVEKCQYESRNNYYIPLKEQNIPNPNYLQSKLQEALNFNEDMRSNGKRQGRWLHTEHFRFIKGCLLYGNNWKQVKECVKTRSSAQIRSHAQKYLIKLCKKYKSNQKLKFDIYSKDILYPGHKDLLIEGKNFIDYFNYRL